MQLLNEEAEQAMREELESFIEQKKLQLGQIEDPEQAKKLEQSLDKMRFQMEQLIQLFRYQHQNEEN